MSLSPGSPVPLYAQLAEVLRQRLARGVWKEGERLPSLEELAREFGVARVTARQAIEILIQAGLVTARQGRGTFPTGRSPTRRLPVQSSLAALVDMLDGDRPRLLNIEEGRAAPTLLEADGTPAARYVHMRRVHIRDDIPYCVISIYLDARIFRLAPERFRREVLIPILVSLPGVTIGRASQTLTVAAADAEVAGHLGLAIGAPVGEVRRVFRDPDGVVIYLGEVTYRGDHVRLDMELGP